MAKKKVKEEIGYVASTMNITYTVPKGLIHLLAGISNKTSKEVWCILSEMSNICAHRLSKRTYSYATSWTSQLFPGTDVKLRIDMGRHSSYRSSSTEDKKVYYTAKVKINGHQNEQFTQTQVNDYITESILLGDDEEEEIISE